MEHKKVVVIGGGIMGCGILYHLAHEGWNDTILFEKNELTAGSTWHAAGQITHSISNFGLGKCVKYNTQLYKQTLKNETGQDVTWHGCGSLRIAYSTDEMDWLKHTLSVTKAIGLNVQIISVEEIKKLHPFYNTDGIIGALHTPDDGHVDPSNVTQALAAGARKLGAKIVRNCRVTNVEKTKNNEWKIVTEQGEVVAEHVVNAAGAYARQIGEWNNLNLPMVSMTHHYFVTGPVKEFEEWNGELPVVRDDRLVSGYIRMEQKSGLIGIYEKQNTNSVWEDHCPWEAQNELFEPDYDRVMPWLENAMERMPILNDAGIKREVHGAISHPPDGNPLIGPVAGQKNYWCCCGTQIGIGWGPGLTRELARWMVHGAADISMREFDPRRFGEYATKEWQSKKAHEDYKLRHEIPFPHFNRLEGRPIKKSPIHNELEKKGAVFEEVFGFERPRWFAKGDVEQRDYYSFRRSPVHDIVGGEIQAVRQSVGVMDITAFTKVEVSGEDAPKLLDYLVPNKLPETGKTALAYLLNDRGRIEIETTIARIEENKFYLVCAAFFENRLVDHLNFSKGDYDVTVISLSGKWAALALNGPNSQKIFARITEDGEAMSWMSAKQMIVAGETAWVLKMSYAGEQGFEIHAPNKNIIAIYDAIISHGEEFGIQDYGSFAMNVMRMEKAFGGAGEFTNEVTMPEANVMRFANIKKEFRGKKQTKKSMEEDMPWVRAYLEVEPDGINDGNGGEAVLHNQKVVGSVSSIVYGHSVKKILAFAYIKPEVAKPNTMLEVVIAGETRNAKVLDKPAYDPQNLLPRGKSNGENE